MVLRIKKITKIIFSLFLLLNLVFVFLFCFYSCSKTDDNKSVVSTSDGLQPSDNDLENRSTDYPPYSFESSANNTTDTTIEPTVTTAIDNNTTAANEVTDTQLPSNQQPSNNNVIGTDEQITQRTEPTTTADTNVTSPPHGEENIPIPTQKASESQSPQKKIEPQDTGDEEIIDGKDYIGGIYEKILKYKNPKGIEYLVEAPPSGRTYSFQKMITPLSLTPVGEDYFEDTAFLGDSVTLGFELFRNHIKFQGNKIDLRYKVISVGSYGVYNATREISEKSIHPLYEGKQRLPQDILKIYDVKRVFICLGLNDVGWETVPQYLSYYKELIDNITAQIPDIEIVIMSITPLTAEGEKAHINNTKIMEANEALIRFAYEYDIPFLDYAAALRDETNAMYKELSSDNYCHITLNAYDKLLEYILYHPIY